MKIKYEITFNKFVNFRSNEEKIYGEGINGEDYTLRLAKFIALERAQFFFDGEDFSVSVPYFKSPDGTYHAVYGYNDTKRFFVQIKVFNNE